MFHFSLKILFLDHFNPPSFLTKVLTFDLLLGHRQKSASAVTIEKLKLQFVSFKRKVKNIKRNDAYRLCRYFDLISVMIDGRGLLSDD